uniref:NB-ARC domain-containing protein n=1 Tax=Lactuca sativa TaxID=4236 RepID=A0A9R1XN61_LACSA|nr:hypothetical protein LSAT_V11C300148170 [Lactuca sativa]
MESFPNHELPKLNVLTHLSIVNCDSMDASFSGGLWPPTLCRLKIGGLKTPISKWDPQTFPTSLVVLSLHGGQSENVSNFSQLSHFPSSITSLEIYGFEKLESVSMGLQHLTSLQHLVIYKCLETIDLPDKLFPLLLSLKIRGCPNVTTQFSRPKISFLKHYFRKH